MVPIISPLLSVRKDPSKAAATFSQNPTNIRPNCLTKYETAYSTQGFFLFCKQLPCTKK